MANAEMKARESSEWRSLFIIQRINNNNYTASPHMRTLLRMMMLLMVMKKVLKSGREDACEVIYLTQIFSFVSLLLCVPTRKHKK